MEWNNLGKKLVREKSLYIQEFRIALNTYGSKIPYISYIIVIEITVYA